jgi:Protein of unknown function (DUF4013)
VDRIIEAFAWPFRDPEWLPKLLIIALTLLIPIVGSINGLGWMLASLDRLRAGEERLAPANLTYLGRGFRLFAVELIYGIGITVVAFVIFVPAFALSVQQGQGSANAALIAAAVFLNLLGFSAITLLSLALTFAMPAIVLATDSGGVGGGIRVGAVVRRSRMNLSHTLIAGLMLIAASFVGSFGAVVCVIGIFVTSAYALAMQAWIIRSFEKG